MKEKLQVRPITEINGIGETFAKELAKYDLRYVHDLLLSSVEDLELVLAKIPNFPEDKLPEIRAAAALLLLPQINGTVAEKILENTPEGLISVAVGGPNWLRNFLPDLSEDEASDIRVLANHLLYASLTIGKVYEAEKPVIGALITTHTYRAETNEAGMFLVPVLAEEGQYASIEAEGYISSDLMLYPSEGPEGFMEIELVPGTGEAEIEDENDVNQIVGANLDMDVWFDDVVLEKVPEETLFVVRHVYEDSQVRLNTARRALRDGRLYIQRCKVQNSKVENAGINQMHVYKDGKFKALGMDFVTWRASIDHREDI